MRRIAEDAYNTMSASDRAEFAAYTRGVNHFIQTHRSSLHLNSQCFAMTRVPGA